MFHAPKLKHLMHLACPLRTKHREGSLDCNMIFGAGRKNHLRFGVNHNNNYEIAMILFGPGKNHFESAAWILGALSAQMPATDSYSVQRRKTTAKFAAVDSISTVDTCSKCKHLGTK